MINEIYLTTDNLISVNLLTYAVFIINYAVASYINSLHPPSKDNPYPVLLDWADNMTANKWVLKSTATNPAGRDLSHLFCALRINMSLDLNRGFIPDHIDIIVDRISRVFTVSDYPLDFYFLSHEVP